MLHGEKMPFDNITTMKQEQEVILKIQSTREILEIRQHE